MLFGRHRWLWLALLIVCAAAQANGSPTSAFPCVDADALLARAPRDLGLLGMRERAEELGGQWSLPSRPGQGTTIQAFMPQEMEPDPCV